MYTVHFIAMNSRLDYVKLIMWFIIFSGWHFRRHYNSGISSHGTFYIPVLTFRLLTYFLWVRDRLSSYLPSSFDLSRSFTTFLVHIIDRTSKVRVFQKQCSHPNFPYHLVWRRDFLQAFVFWSVLVHTSFVYHFLRWPSCSWLWVSANFGWVLLCKLSRLNTRVSELPDEEPSLGVPGSERSYIGYIFWKTHLWVFFFCAY